MSYKKIIISGGEYSPKIEGVSYAAITPGNLVEFTTVANQVRNHTTRGGMVVPRMVALEDSLQGNDIDDNYSASGRVQITILRPGDEFCANYTTNVGWTPTVGDKVISDGNGKVSKFQAMVDSSGLGETNPPECIVGIVRETGSAGRVRVMAV